MPSLAQDSVPTRSPHDLCGLTADYVALTSAEIVSAEDRVGKFWAGDGSRECMLDDDCLVARHVVPFGSYPWHLWHHIAAEILGEAYDLQDASQIERLIQLRGLFPRDGASAPHWIALDQTDLATLLERQEHPDSERAQLSVCASMVSMRVWVFPRPIIMSMRADLPERPEIDLALTFDQAYADPEGQPYDLIFDRPDLTTAHASGLAFAALHELQIVLTEERPVPPEGRLQSDAMFETYTAKLADMIATAPACLALAGDSNDRIAAAIDFVEQRCPGWSEGFPTSPSGGELRPIPLAWSRQIAIAGLRDARRTCPRAGR
jgi:hypothetical protein